MQPGGGGSQEDEEADQNTQALNVDGEEEERELVTPLMGNKNAANIASPRVRSRAYLLLTDWYKFSCAGLITTSTFYVGLWLKMHM